MTSTWGLRLVAVMLLAVGCGDNIKPVSVDSGPVPDAGRSEVERGRYIMNTLGACTFCHTPLNPDGSRNLTKLFAGWSCSETIPFLDVVPAAMDPGGNVGCLSSRNLTNHSTGLANATDQQIKDAIRLGTRTDGKKLVPVMPYYIFHNMADADLDAIIAYLRTVPGVDNPIAPNQEPWLSINDGTTVATPIDPATIPMPAAGPDQASALRGRYLSSMVGLCIDCHTPEPAPVGNPPMPPLFPRPIDMTRPYAGGRMFPKEALGLLDPSYPAVINVRNLTPHATGLAGFTVPQIKAAIADGKDPMGNAVCAGTHGSGISPYAALDDQDLTDIANYIASLPPIDSNTGANCAGPPVP
ncbi:MAG: putative diheme cytochrome c-553 [Myxococcales bacterium]|nr:putative diheme cytochrome c-553 [Myxococcales bacterium]